MSESEKLIREALALNPVEGPWLAEYFDAVTPPAVTALLADLDQLRTRVFEADLVMLLLTADHNSTPNYVKGFQAASEYFAKYDEIVAQQVAA